MSLSSYLNKEKENQTKIFEDIENHKHKDTKNTKTTECRGNPPPFGPVHDIKLGIES